VDEQKLHAYFKSDIEFETEGNFRILAKEDIDIKSSDSNIRIEAKKDIDILSTTEDVQIAAPAGNLSTKSGIDTNQSAGADFNQKCSSTCKIQSVNTMHLADGVKIDLSAPNIGFGEGSGTAAGAGDAESATDAAPEGERDT